MGAKGRKRGNEKAGGDVIRKEAVVAGGHHGGAWKVAYADFVTAMMAFFLLMWLINATTEAQRKGLANYFAPTAVLSFHYSGSGRPFGGKTPFSHGQMVSNKGAVQAITGKAQPEPNARPDLRTRQPGTRAPESGVARARQPAAGSPAAGPVPAPPGGVAGPDVGAPALPLTAGPGAGHPASPAARQEASFERARQQIRAAILHDPSLAAFAKQFAVDVTSRGLRIQILDGRHRPMFTLGSAVLAPAAQQFLAQLAPIVARLVGPVAVSGFTDAAPYHGGGMSNWDLSTERANAARSLLVAGGLPGARIVRVSGHADRELLLPAQPLAAANRRVSILVERVPGARAKTAAAGASPPGGLSPAIR